jgi:hypothetical protein
MGFLAAIFVCIAFVLLMVGMVLGLALIRAWALTKLWAWFVVPFFGVKPLTVAMAYGLMLIVTLFMQGIATQKADEKDGKTGAWSILIVSWLGPVITVGAGWVVKTYFLG